MNSYERMMCVLDGKKPDRLPVLPMVREWCSTQAGFDFSEEMESVEKHVFAQSYCVKEFAYDVVWDMFSVHAESEAMGSKLKIQHGIPPSIVEPAVLDYDADLPELKLFDPYQNRRLSIILEGIRRLKSRFSGEVPVMGYIQAPFRHASMLRGMEALMRDLFKKKDRARELCELALYSQVVWGTAVIGADADILFISDPASSGDAISKKHWEQWGLGLTTRLVSVLKRSGKKILMHICGDTTDRLESLASTGVHGLSLDEKVDFEAARKILGPDYCLMGNVSTTLLALGRPEDVEEATREVIAKAGKEGHLIVSGGCQLADICPPENIRTMVRAAREYRL